MRNMVPQWEMWWLRVVVAQLGRCGGPLGDVLAQWEMWFLSGRCGAQSCGGSVGEIGSSFGAQ